MSRSSRTAFNPSSAALTFDDGDDVLAELDEHSGSEETAVWVCRFGPDHMGGWGSHFHRQHQLAWASTGVLSVHVAGRVWVVPSDRAVWLPSGCAHDVVSRRGTTLHCLYVWPEACPLTAERPQLVAVSPMLREVLLLLTEVHDEAPVSEAAATLLFSLIESSDEPADALPMPRDPSAHAVACELLESPRAAWSLDQWARRHHVSVSTLRRRFVDETGLTFSEWRRHARLDASLQLLADGMTVESVSSRVGYASANGYIDAFKRRFGTTPARFPSVPGDLRR